MANAKVKPKEMGHRGPAKSLSALNVSENSVTAELSISMFGLTASPEWKVHDAVNRPLSYDIFKDGSRLSVAQIRVFNRGDEGKCSYIQIFYVVCLRIAL